MGFSPRKLSWKLFQLLPEKIKSGIIRNSISIDESQLEGIEIRVASNKNEVNQAFKLLYESYHANGLMDRKDHELRVTKYHCLPTSIIIVAIYNGEVIGTVTHVLDSQLGLPSEGAVDISSFRKRGKRIAEISALAIKKEFRRSHSLMFSLTRYMYHYATKYAGVNHWIIGVRSNVATYYQALFFFHRFKTKKISHGFVNNSPSYFLYANLSELESLFFKHYSHKEDSKNLFKFYIQQDLKKIGNFEHFKYNLPIHYGFEQDSLELFFREKEKIIESLGEKEKLEVLNAYKEIYPNFFNRHETDILKFKKARNGVRYVSNYEIEILRLDIPEEERYSLDFKDLIHGHILNFSRTGIMIKASSKLASDESYLVRFVRGMPIKELIEIRILRDLKNNIYSGKLINNQKSWIQFIKNLELSIHNQNSDHEDHEIKKAA